jgi:PPOX class probable F420-dependent enzyme
MRVARLATADLANRPHVVPIVFAADEERLYTPLDGKPKRVPVRQLTRVRNLLANPQVAVVMDAYDEDWSRLAWVLVRGSGALVEDGPLHRTGVRLLTAKYPQYHSMPLDDRPLIVVTPERVTSWGL